MQKEIVAEIEGYQKVIDGARAVLDHYRPHIPIHPDWPMVPLGEICSLGGTITTDVDLARPYFGADSIESNTGKLLKTETAESQRVNGPVYEFAGERLLYSKIRPYLNKLTVVDLRGYCSSDMYPLLPDRAKVLITYLATYMLSDTFNERIRGYYERAEHSENQPLTTVRDRNSPPTPRHAASHRRRDRSRASAGRSQPRTDDPLRAKDPRPPSPASGAKKRPPPPRKLEP